MKIIIFGILSLLFSMIDYSLAINLVSRIYGERVSLLMTSFPINVIYFVLVFFVEIITIRGYQKLLLRVSRVIWKN